MKLTDYLTALYRAFISPSKYKKSYSQYAEDLIIQMYFPKSKKDGKYVDVGCHHPKRGSNTYGFYKKGWSGILIDLEKSKVKANQFARPRDKVILAAVSDKEEWLEIYSDKNFSTNTTINKVEANDKKISIGKIHSETLSNILSKNNFSFNFELLSIDVEGVDLEVLKGLGLDIYHPEIICIENWNSKDGISGILKSEIHQFLNNHKYKLVAFSGLSTIYQRSIA
jgi:FkbM family methyltransferase